MRYEIRPTTPEEFAVFTRTGSLGFNDSPPGDDDVALQATIFEFDRSLSVLDEGRIVAGSSAYSFEVTVPGGRSIPAAGVSYVSVLPTYRRQGILREMMSRLLDEAARRAEPVAILTASESSIYGRFGFGIAASDMRLSLATAHATLSSSVETPGSVIMPDAARAAAILPELYERIRPQLAGAIARSRAWWDGWLSDPPWWRHDTSTRFYLAYQTGEGAIEGYLTYRSRRDWDQGNPNHTAIIGELITETPAARAALWRAILSLDLVASVETLSSPLDEPLRWMLADPRRLRVTRLGDALWLRILDVPATLAARTYGTAGELVIEIDDGGRYRLRTDGSDVDCRATDATPDLRMGIADLGAIYLGGVRSSTLARAGRVQARGEGALALADALFATDRAPFPTTPF